MEQYLIDTNIVSDYFSASLPETGLLFMDGIIDAIPILSVITQIELLCWNTNETIEHQIEYFIADSIIMDITPDVIRNCVNIRKGKKIKTPDAIIAATALTNKLTLITNNEKDFNWIPDLKIKNPYNL
jgi:predicted nucleic acid-binding protein